MKLFRMLFCASILIPGWIAGAQMKVGDVAVNVPFRFHAAGQEFPAGHYILAMRDESMRIFNSQTSGIYVSTHSAMRTSSNESKVVFHRYGSTFFLSEVWMQGKTIGKQLFVSGAERELRSQQSGMQLAVVQISK